MADYKVVDAEKLDADLTGMADEVRTLADTDSKMSLEAMTDNVAQANSKVDSQSEIIAQIKRTLQGKAGSGGDLSAIENLIDESGVLDSTEGTVEEKVEQLVDKAELLSTVSGITYRRNAEITSINVDCSGFTTADSMCLYCEGLITAILSNTQNIKEWGSCFQYCKNLETIEILDFSSATGINNTFYNCNGIKNIKFVANSISLSLTLISQNLTAESVQSVIDGLATVTTAQTLKLGNKIVLTDEQKATINSKGWTLVQ